MMQPELHYPVSHSAYLALRQIRNLLGISSLLTAVSASYLFSITTESIENIASLGGGLIILLLILSVVCFLVTIVHSQVCPLFPFRLTLTEVGVSLAGFTWTWGQIARTTARRHRKDDGIFCLMLPNGKSVEVILTRVTDEELKHLSS